MEKTQPQNRGETFRLLRRFGVFFKGCGAKYLGGILCVVVTVMVSFITPLLVGGTVDAITDSVTGNTGAAVNMPGFLANWFAARGGVVYIAKHVWIVGAMLLGVQLFGGVFQFLRGKWSAEASEGIAEKMRNRLYEHLQAMSYDYHVKAETGDLIQRCTLDVDTIRRFLANQLIEIFRAVIMVILALSLMSRIHVKLTLISLILIPPLFILAMWFFKWVQKLFTASDEADGKLSAMLQESLTGVRVVRAFGRERFEKDKFNKQNDLFSDLWVRLGHVMGVNWGIGDLLSGIQVLTIIAAGIVFVVDGAITEGEYLAFVAYNSMLVWPTRSLGRLLSELSKTGISSKRIFEILDAEPEKDAETPVTPPMDRDIVFKHVNFSYGASGEVLHDIDLKIPAGTTLGILGSTGSGKSTLTYLLDRLYELPEGSGEITIGGVDIRNIALSHLRGNIGIVLQEPFLFSKSFKDTISDGSNRHDIESVRKYARLAVIDDTIDRFAEGYDTQIGERGVTISGGQKQRVAIARMLMQNTPIKIFDDSLSAVDMETDAKIRESINKNVRGTTILIAHRITTIMNADQIIVMDKGRIVQRGTHETLSKEDGIYKRIYDTQRSAT